jgi:hypothetical protein
VTAAVVERHGQIQARHDVPVNRDAALAQGITQDGTPHGQLHDFGGPRRDHGQTLVNHAAAERGASLVMTAGGQKNLLPQSQLGRQIPAQRADRPAFGRRQGREASRIDATSLQDIAGPAPRRQVVHLGTGGQAVADHGPAAQPPEKEVLVQQELTRLAPHLRLVPLEPEQLGQRIDGVDGHAGAAKECRGSKPLD